MGLWRAYFKVVELKDGCVPLCDEFYHHTACSPTQPLVFDFGDVLVVDVKGIVRASCDDGDMVNILYSS